MKKQKNKNSYKKFYPFFLKTVNGITTTKTGCDFDDFLFSNSFQEKLPIIYANIRV
jgi:hypothetical protein